MPWFLEKLPITPIYNGDVKAYVDGREYFFDLYHALESASRYILLTGLHFQADFELIRPGDVSNPPRTLVEVLKRAGERGVVVNLLVNQFWANEQSIYAPSRQNLIIVGGKLAGYLPRTWDLFEQLQHTPNVYCRTDIHPNNFVFASHHQKTVVIDDAYAFVGGMDITTEDGDRWDTASHSEDNRNANLNNKYWHDVHLRIAGPAVALVHDNFRLRWTKGRLHRLRKGLGPSPGLDYPRFPEISGVPEPQTNRPPVPPYSGIRRTSFPLFTETNEDSIVQVVATRPAPDQDGHELDSKLAYLSGINMASHYIYLENQWVSDEDIWKALARACARNAKNADFRVVVVIPYKSFPAAGLPANQDIDPATRIGRVIDECASPETFGMYSIVQPSRRYSRGTSAAIHPVYVHSKLLIVDDCWVFAGSANAGGTSMEGVRGGRKRPDSELGAIVLDRNFAKSLRQRLWSEHLQRPVSETYLPSDADAFRAAAGRGNFDSRVRFAPKYEAALRGERYRREQREHPMGARYLWGPAERGWQQEKLLFLRSLVIAPTFPRAISELFPIALTPAAFHVSFQAPLPLKLIPYFRWEAELGTLGAKGAMRRVVPLVDAHGTDLGRAFSVEKWAMLPVSAAETIRELDPKTETVEATIHCHVQVLPDGAAPDESTPRGEWSVSYQFRLIATGTVRGDLPETLRELLR